MNSRVSWSVDGIDPSVRERAEAAARRAGMSLNDWLNSTIGNSTPPDFRRPMTSGRRAERGKPRRRRHPPAARFHHPPDRTDFAAGAAQRAPRATRPASRVARQLNDAISRLDARLSQISNPQAARPAPPQSPGQSHGQSPGQTGSARSRRSSAPRPVYRASPPLSPASLDFAIAEIAARQNELDDPPPRRCRRAARRRSPGPHRCRYAPPPMAAYAPPIAPAPRRPVRTSPRWNGICSRSRARSRRCSVPTNRAVDRRLPQRARRNSSRHHRSDAAPGDRIDRERHPLAVAPHRREPPERHRRPGARQYRARAVRNPRGAALADAGRAARRLRRGDPQSRRQARHDPARQ